MSNQQPKKKSNRRKPDPHRHRSRKGMDLVFIFYAAVLLLILIMGIQFAAYHIYLYGNQSFAAGILCNILGIKVLNLDPTWTPVQFFRNIPTDVLAGILGTYSLIYSGGEGTTSLLTSWNSPKGVSAPMPEYKIKRFMGMLITWFLITALSTYFQFNIRPSDEALGISFNIMSYYYGLGSSMLTYVYSRQAPKIGQNVGSPNTSPPPPPPPPSPSTGGGTVGGN